MKVSARAAPRRKEAGLGHDMVSVEERGWAMRLEGRICLSRDKKGRRCKTCCGQS